MKTLLTFLVSTVFLFSACKEDNHHEEDADAEADVPEVDAPDEAEDPRPDEPADDDVDVEDAEPDEVEEPDLPPSCARQAIACGGRSSAAVEPPGEGTMDKYVLFGRELEYDESGAEFVFSFSPEGPGRVTAEIVDYSEGDLDIIVLEDRCAEDAAVAFGDSVVAFTADAASSTFIAVDGRDGASGPFELILTCEEAFEDCGNGEDDNGDALVDCADPQCLGTAPCYELDCGDGADDDGDGDVDCEDFDCIGTDDCAGGAGFIGDPCDSHDDCASGQCYLELETGWPGGYCIIASSIRHCDEITCPEGTECEPIGFTSVTGPWVCGLECGAEEPCREGYLCEDHLCFPECLTGSHCVETGFCEIETGLCSADPTEVCDGGLDEDEDGDTDCEDTECMFRAACVTPVPLNGGDGCADAVALPLPSGERGTVVVDGTTAGMADDLTPGCETLDAADVVYSFTLTMPAFAKVDLLGGRIEPRIQDTILALRSDCEGEDLACNNDIADGIYKHSYLETSLAAGTYTIIVDGFDTRTGQFTLGLNLSDP